MRLNFLERGRASFKQVGARGTIKNIWRYLTTEIYLVVEATFSPLLINRVIRIFSVQSAALNTNRELVDFAIRFKSFPIGIKALQEPEQLMYLVELLSKERPKYMMEIGTAYGGSLFLFSRVSAPEAKILSINMPFSELNRICLQQRYKLYRRFATKRQNVCIIEADSHKKETFDKARRILGEDKLDFLFIDGDHSYEGAKMDFVMYSKLVRRGGIVAYDDIGTPEDKKPSGPRRAWDEIKKGHRHREFISPSGAGLGVLYI